MRVARCNRFTIWVNAGSHHAFPSAPTPHSRGWLRSAPVLRISAPVPGNASDATNACYQQLRLVSGPRQNVGHRFPALSSQSSCLGPVAVVIPYSLLRARESIVVSAISESRRCRRGNLSLVCLGFCGRRPLHTLPIDSTNRHIAGGVVLLGEPTNVAFDRIADPVCSDRRQWQGE